MKNKVFKAFCKVPMNLQLFAEGDGAGTGDESGNGGGAGGAGEEGNEPQSFDDFLKTGGNQAEFDRRVQKAVNTAAVSYTHLQLGGQIIPVVTITCRECGNAILVNPLIIHCTEE